MLHMYMNFKLCKIVANSTGKVHTLNARQEEFSVMVGALHIIKMQLDVDMSPPANITFRLGLTHLTFHSDAYMTFS